MGRHLRILIQFWRAALIQSMEYRTSFLLSVFANGVDFCLGLAQYALFFSVADTVAGWELSQLLSFYAVFMIVFSLHFMLLYPNLAAISRLVNAGTLDLVLVKPVSSQIVLSFREISFEEAGSLLAALVLLAGLLLTGRVSVGLIQFAGFLLALCMSFIIVYAAFLLLLGLAIRLEKFENTSDLLWTIFGLCRYPVDIFPKSLRWVFYGFFPIAFVSTVPAMVLTQGMSFHLLVGGVSVCCLFGLTATRFWAWSLGGYTSAGG